MITKGRNNPRMSRKVLNHPWRTWNPQFLSPKFSQDQLNAVKPEYKK
jgi:hypothetical protein